MAQKFVIKFPMSEQSEALTIGGNSQHSCLERAPGKSQIMWK